MAIQVKDIDPDYIELKAPDFFYLWCCDCKLRHVVMVDRIKDRVQIGLIADREATQMRRANAGIEVKRVRRKIWKRGS